MLKVIDNSDQVLFVLEDDLLYFHVPALVSHDEEVKEHEELLLDPNLLVRQRSQLFKYVPKVILVVTEVITEAVINSFTSLLLTDHGYLVVECAVDLCGRGSVGSVGGSAVSVQFGFKT